MSVVLAALDALDARAWERFAAALHPEVVHLTPGVPQPIVGREAFVQMSRDAVARTPDVRFTLERIVEDGQTAVVIGEWHFTGSSGLVRQPAVSVIEVEDGLIVRDTEYFGLAM